jgi:alkyl sulfatase BDS1-like metallo-beta-lactamase superfamily hydrolase
MRNFLIIPILFIFLVSCSNSEDFDIPKISKLEKLEEHSNQFIKGIYSYDNGIHVAIGFGIANSIMVEGEGGNIIIDTTDDVSQAKEVLSEFQKINQNPIKAIIYTHNHGDHVFGASEFYNAQEEKPLVIAHSTTAEKVEKILGIINPIITLRSGKMFGTNLDDNELINVGLGPYLSAGRSSPGYIAPTMTFEKELKLEIAGHKVELYHAPGETDDQLFVWFPELSALMPGDNFYTTFPNLYTIRGTSHRDVMGWVNSIDKMRSLDPQYLFPSHTMPVVGEEISNALIIYRDGMQYVHDQTVRLMNKGLTPDEIVEELELPQNLKESPYLAEFYGTVRYSVRSIFNGYLGWFSGDLADLDPLNIDEKSQKISNLVGGNENLFSELTRASYANEHQWVLELSKMLISLDFKTEEVMKIRNKSVMQIGIYETNPPKRNFFLSSAKEFMEDRDPAIGLSNSDTLYQIPVENFFSILSVRLNPSKVDGELMNGCFIFDNKKKIKTTIRNQVLEVSSYFEEEDCDFIVLSEEITFKEVLAGIKGPIKTLGAGEMEMKKGNSVAFLTYLSKFTD